jgi:hypothetical protein
MRWPRRLTKARIPDVIFYATLAGASVLSFRLPDERDLVQGIAFGATGALLLVQFLEYLQRKERAASDPAARVSAEEPER